MERVLLASLQDSKYFNKDIYKTHIQKKFSYTRFSPLINEEDTCFYCSLYITQLSFRQFINKMKQNKIFSSCYQRQI